MRLEDAQAGNTHDVDERAVDSFDLHIESLVDVGLVFDDHDARAE